MVEELRRHARGRLSVWLLKLAEIDDIKEMPNLLKAEAIFLDGEALVSQDRPERLASINAAMEQHATIAYHVSLLLGSNRYKTEVNPLFSASRDRIKGVPFDMARKALRSHVTRYANDLKACRGPDDERNYYKSHLAFARNLQRLYIAAQEVALAL